MKRGKEVLFVAGLSACALLLGQTGCRAATLDPNTASEQRAIPYVPTRHDTVKDMLWLADVGPKDVVYDLGSGDGRVVIAAVRDFGAKKAVGIEIKPELVAESRRNAAKAGVSDRVEFIQGDLFTSDFSQASVVVLYLGHGANLDLRAKIVRDLKPGSRVVSHKFGMGEWPADKRLDVRTPYLGMCGTIESVFGANPNVPDFDSTGSGFSHDMLLVWIVPAPVAGVWRGKVRLESGEGTFVLTLRQRLSRLSGTFQFTGQTDVSGGISADLWGDHLRCWCIPTGQNSRSSQMWFEGYASGDTLKGSLWVPQGGKTREVKWIGQRDKADLAGIWEWAGPKDLPVQLKIERRDGQLAAAYTDKSQRLSRYEDASRPIPITDIYDFGAGLYFTLLIGRQENGLRAGPDDGWLIGEAAVHDDTISGTISFFPYPNRFFGTGASGRLAQPVRDPNSQNGPRDWQARRVVTSQMDGDRGAVEKAVKQDKVGD